MKSSQGCDRGTDQEEGKNYPIPKVSFFEVHLVVTFSNQKVSQWCFANAQHFSGFAGAFYELM